MIPVVFLTILGLAYLILVVSAVVVVVLDNHNPMRAMSWVVVLLFLPVVGLILYVFFAMTECCCGCCPCCKSNQVAPEP